MKRLFGRFVGELGSMIGMRKFAPCIIIMGVFLLSGGCAGHDLSPERTVSNYYNAIKNSRFEEAYDYVSEGMKDGRAREKWAKDWRTIFEAGNVVIFEFSVSPAKIEGDKATVPVMNRSRCILDPKNQPEGIVEHEIDYLIKENGVWKIDRTEVLVEDTN